MAAPVMGLDPTSPVIEEANTSVMPDFDRIAKLLAEPRFTGACAAAATAGAGALVAAEATVVPAARIDNAIRGTIDRDLSLKASPRGVTA
jgi:hypothetical protein